MMRAASTVQIKHYFQGPVTSSCTDCPVMESCVAAALPMSHKGCINHSLCFRRKLIAGSALYREGDPLETIYVIQAGAFKSQLPGENGRDQITGIHLPGEVVGIEGIASGRHTRNLIALEGSLVCVIPMGVLDGLMRELPGVQRWFHRMLSREIVAVTRKLALLGRRKAEERLAAFLLDLSERFAALGHSPRHFDLPLSRRDIACHLGLSSATVSRTFARFGRESMVSTRKQHVRMLDIDALNQTAAGRLGRKTARCCRVVSGSFGRKQGIRSGTT